MFLCICRSQTFSYIISEVKILIFQKYYLLSEMKNFLNRVTSIKSKHDKVSYCLIYVISGTKIFFMIFSAIVDQNCPRQNLIQFLKRIVIIYIGLRFYDEVHMSIYDQHVKMKVRIWLFAYILWYCGNKLCNCSLV